MQKKRGIAAGLKDSFNPSLLRVPNDEQEGKLDDDDDDDDASSVTTLYWSEPIPGTFSAKAP